MGFSLKGTLDAIERQNLHVLQIVVRQHDEIIAEHSYQPPTPILLWSVSKSITSMAAGIAIQEDHFKLTDPLYRYMPEIDALATPENGWGSMTVRDLLTMQTGHASDPMDPMIRSNGPYEGITGVFLKAPLVYPPGQAFVYNNASSYMSSRLITVTTGLPMLDFLMPRLFEPMGIARPRWESDQNGIQYGCSGLFLTAKELSLLGQLLLNKGAWNGQSLISADYVKAATSKQARTSKFDMFFANEDHRKGYGYGFWLNRVAGTYRMDGLFGQYVVMLPEQDAVVVFLSQEPVKMTSILNLVWDTILDAL